MSRVWMRRLTGFFSVSRGQRCIEMWVATPQGVSPSLVICATGTRTGKSLAALHQHSLPKGAAAGGPRWAAHLGRQRANDLAIDLEVEHVRLEEPVPHQLLQLRRIEPKWDLR